MKLKTLAALLLLAHALLHPAVHALPRFAPAQEQAQAPASSSGPQSQIASGVRCPACLAQRGIFFAPVLTLAVQPHYQPLVLAPLVPRAFLFSCVPPARAPPAT